MDIIKKFEPIFGKWYVESLIGAGSYGRVYKIYREQFNRRFYSALKYISLPPDDSEIRQMRSAGMDAASINTYYTKLANDWSEEAALMESLRGHTNIVGFEDSGAIPKPDGIGYDVFIRMELLESLPSKLTDKPLPAEETLKLGIDMCNALVLCESQGIIHRDIKPDNIFVSPHGDYKLGDFGIARRMEKTTSFMSRKGTCNYMAPEVFNGNEYGAQCDIYSLGVVLYRLMNRNRLPFQPNAPQPITPMSNETALANRMRGVAMPKPLDADDEFSRIILKACAYDPKDRYESAEQMCRELIAYRDRQNERTMMLPPQMPVVAPKAAVGPKSAVSQNAFAAGQRPAANQNAFAADKRPVEKRESAGNRQPEIRPNFLKEQMPVADRKPALDRNSIGTKRAAEQGVKQVLPNFQPVNNRGSASDSATIGWDGPFAGSEIRERDSYANEDEEGSDKKKKRNSALINAAIIIGCIALIGLIACIIMLLNSDNGSTPKDNNAPYVSSIEQDGEKYNITVKAKEGTVLVFETSSGMQSEHTLSNKNYIVFSVPVSELLPVDPIEGKTCIISPKIYEKTSNGKLTPIESKSITIEVPQINIEFYSPDTIYVDYGSAIIRGKLTDPNQYGAKLSVNGDSISVDGEGNFSYAASFDRTGEYELEFTAKLGGHSIYRKTFKAIVTR